MNKIRGLISNIFYTDKKSLSKEDCSKWYANLLEKNITKYLEYKKELEKLYPDIEGKLNVFVGCLGDTIADPYFIINDTTYYIINFNNLEDLKVTIKNTTT